MKRRAALVAILFFAQVRGGYAQGLLAGLWGDLEGPGINPYVRYALAMVAGVDVTTDDTGKEIFVEHGPRRPTRGMTLGSPVVEVVPPSGMGGIGGPSGGVAAVDISPAYTLFALAANGNVLQLDIRPQASPAEVRSLPTGERLRAGVTSPGNGFLYLISAGAQLGSFSPSLRFINLTTFQTDGSLPLPATSIPSVVTVTPDGKYLFVAGALSAQTLNDPAGVDCHLIDAASRSIVKTFRFLGSAPRPKIVMSPDGNRVYLTVSNGVAVIDVLTQTVSHTIGEPEFAFLGGPQHIAIDPAGTSLYMAPVRSSGQSGVGVYDLATSSRTKFIPIASISTMVMAVTADGRYLVVKHIVPDPNTGRNDFPSLEFIRLPSGTLEATRPWSGLRDVPLTVHSLVAIPRVGEP